MFWIYLLIMFKCSKIIQSPLCFDKMARTGWEREEGEGRRVAAENEERARATGYE